MTWLISILVAVISGVVGLLLGGFIANSCVSWYQISSREGKSGFFVIFIALVGGVSGSIVGLIAARLVAWNYGPGFGKEFLIALGTLLIVAGVSALLCRTLADIAPTIDGRELTLAVEFRFPTIFGPEKPPTENDEWQFTFASMSGQTRRKYRDGVIQTGAARYENGQWIVPAQAELFTERGSRCVTLAQRDATEAMSFLLPLPARPDAKFQEWSDWTPRQQADGQPWPSEKMSCRFRVQKITDPTVL